MKQTIVPVYIDRCWEGKTYIYTTDPFVIIGKPLVPHSPGTFSGILSVSRYFSDGPSERGLKDAMSYLCNGLFIFPTVKMYKYSVISQTVMINNDMS